MLIAVFLSVASLAGSDPDGVVATAPATRVALDATALPEAPSPEAAAHAQANDPHGLTTDQQIDRWLAARDPNLSTWVEPEAGRLDDRKIHSEVSVGIGTGGYRQYGASVSLPLGESGRLDLSYNQVENSPWRYYGYGDPYFDYGGYAFPGAGERNRRAATFEARTRSTAPLERSGRSIGPTAAE